MMLLMLFACAVVVANAVYVDVYVAVYADVYVGDADACFWMLLMLQKKKTNLKQQIFVESYLQMLFSKK